MIRHSAQKGSKVALYYSLEERRAALIAAAVTGQIEIGTAAEGTQARPLCNHKL